MHLRPAHLRPSIVAMLWLTLAVAASLLAQPARIVQWAAVPGGRLAAGNAQLDVSFGEPGVVATSGAATWHPGFPGLLVNTPPVATNVSVERTSMSAVRFHVSALIAAAGDADSDTLRVAAVAASTELGGRVELDGGWITYLPPAGVTNVDRIDCVVADSFGDTDTVQLAVAFRSVENSSQPSQNGLPSRMDQNGDLQLRFAGIPLRWYRVQMATNVMPPVVWTTLADVRSSVAGQVAFTYTNTSSAPLQFFRSILRP
jgi:hypothetical protein